MKNPELYQKTVDILVNAYFNDTLEHSNCYACAVGNLIGYYLGVVFTHRKMWVGLKPYWDDVFITMDEGQRICHSEYFGEAKRQIDLTGYTYIELAKIEKAFEMAESGVNDDEFMFNGLMAVIETLNKIHKNTDPIIIENQKNRFVKQPA